MRSHKIDKLFLVSILILTIGGFFVFTSASLGLLAREGASFGSVALFQVIGLILGTVAFVWASKVPYIWWRKYSLYIFLAVVLLNLAVFIPGVGLHYGGASRWINLRFITIQPSEFLKISFIIYFAAWLSGMKEKMGTFMIDVVPFAIISAVVGLILLAQSDTDALVVTLAAGLAMLIASGARFRHVLVLILTGAIAVVILASFRPYIKARIMTYLNPGSDLQGAGYQVEQSLIAIGSGGITGRGFGQSVQKFNYLPEPIGDSIFAVAAEEFGFVGGVILIAAYLFFGIRGFRIALNAPDSFSRLLTLGIVILVIVESFMNIAAMLGLVPLSGEPLLFVSHGGTALIIMLGATGIIANISKRT